MSELSPRLQLPFLVAGQAQKEATHNEALTRLDALVQPMVLEVDLDVPPVTPSLGQVWIVGDAPSGGWAGHQKEIAFWTEGGWRFIEGQDGMKLWSLADQLTVRFSGGNWIKGVLSATSLKINGNQVVGARQSAISAPSGGTVIDAEARVAITSILTCLRAHGLISA